jgi:hypothetical protein
MNGDERVYNLQSSLVLSITKLQTLRRQQLHKNFGLKTSLKDDGFFSLQ